MKLNEAMRYVKTIAVDELYASSTGSCIVRYTGEHQGSSALFMVLRLIDDSWCTGRIWLPFGSNALLVYNTVEQFVNHNLQWLILKITEKHGQEWDGWDIYSAESFAELCHRCDPDPIRVYPPYSQEEMIDATV